MSKFDSEQFKALNKHWQEKLKKTGFEDIEQEDGRLKIWSANFLSNHFSDTTYRAKETYYRLASQFLHEYRFKNKKEKSIWEEHCSGKGRREICKLLNLKEFYVRKTLERFIALMKTNLDTE